MTTLHGWIAASLHERAELEAMGIQVGAYKDGFFEPCVVSEEAMQKLNPTWGRRFVWSLKAEGEE